MTIQMQNGSGRNGTVSINGNSYAVSAGIASVNAIDVPAAMRSGWSVLAGQPWPAAQVMQHRVPSAWQQSGTMTAPDGTSISIAGGLCNIPASFVNHYRQLGCISTGLGE